MRGSTQTIRLCDNMAKKNSQKVRAVVPNKSNNEIVLVLQHFENCVDRTVQAFIEGSATEILKEWNPKKKKKPKPKPEAVEPGRPAAPEEDEKKEELNGFHGNGSVLDGESLDSLSEQLDSASLDAAELDSEPAAAETPGGRNLHQPPRGNKNRHRTGSGSHPPASSFPPHSEEQGAGVRKMAPNIDRSVKDLQRCTASLTRYRVVVKEEMDSSIKTMKTTLMDREVTLLGEMDKHFVSERKYDEDLGKALRFTFDLEPLKATITGFGSVYHPNTGYSNRSRCSSTSSVAGPPFGETPPLPPLAPPATTAPPKQTGLSLGAQRYNGASYHDRNFARDEPPTAQSDGGPPAPRSPPTEAPPPSPPPPPMGCLRDSRTMTLEEKKKRESSIKPIY
ncbi:hypothetical protein F7725_001359 [Dissostichus mawsoni]|uniref:Spermatogenesis-associated serine-rich protein 2 n=1 Tax=Dissostichus mawsoni TaxID=36200 RepID=A0A7J5ZH15_DISMA|nr:hypothetical protein F7725_001359 [Dissostichus mawsoni]